jgi:periplasmic divalent cation tolerance protein
MSQAVIALSTCGDPAAGRKIATRLVEDRLAACVNLVDGVTSVYRWQGKIEEDSEVLLIIKTTRERLVRIEEVVRELSGYDVPELIAAEIKDGYQDYLNWLLEAVAEEDQK